MFSIPSLRGQLKKPGVPVSNTGKFQIRWKGGYPYSFSGVNRIWDMTFTSGSNVILVECRLITAKDSSGTGNVITTKDASTFLTSSSTPSDGSAFSITCTPTPSFATATISADPGDAAFTVLYNAGNSDESNYRIATGITFNFLGTNYTDLGVNSNSYVIFGTAATTFSYPSFQWTAGSPAFPGIGVCAHPGSSTDTNIAFLGYRTL